MTMRKVTATEITGLVVSGTADNAGTWNEDVDLDSFVAVPSGATAVLLHVRSTSGSARWSGARTPGKTNPELLADMQSESDGHVVVPLGAGNTVDLYVENLAVDFTILGFFIDWTWFDVDAAAVELPSSGGSMATVTAPADVPASATIMMYHTGIAASGFTGTWRPTGESSASGTFRSPSTLLKLDASRQVDVNTSAAYRIKGYCTTGVTWRTWIPTGETGGSEDGTFYDSSTTSAGSEFAYVATTGNSNTEGVVVRENGSSFPASVQLNNGWGNNIENRSWFAPLDSNGVFEWAVEAATTGIPVTYAHIAAPTSSSEATVTPTTGTLALVGQNALVNDFNTITLRGTLINEAGSPLANVTGINCLVWYNTAPAGAPDESLSSLVTNGNGSYSWALAVGGLVFGEQVYRLIYKDDPPTANNCRVHSPNYES